MEPFFAYANKKEGSDNEDEDSMESIEGGSDNDNDERGEEEVRYAEEEYAGYVENKEEFENAEDEVAIKSEIIIKEFEKIYKGRRGYVSKMLDNFRNLSNFLFLNPRLVALSIAFFTEYKELDQPQVTEFIKSYPKDDPADIIRYIRLFSSIHNK